MLSKNILVVVAHPDDEVIGMGGTIARHIKEGENVSILILGEGIISRYASKIANNEKVEMELAELQNDAWEAHKALGMLPTGYVFYRDLPDNRFDTIPMLDVIKIVEGVIKDTNPQMVYSHFWGDLNIDHRITANATFTACRPYAFNIKSVLAFPVPSSTGWGETFINPNVFIDIKDTLSQKIEAMRKYPSEIRDFPHPRSEEAIVNWARFWGGQVGLEAAEPFVLVRSVE